MFIPSDIVRIKVSNVVHYLYEIVLLFTAVHNWSTVENPLIDEGSEIYEQPEMVIKFQRNPGWISTESSIGSTLFSRVNYFWILSLTNGYYQRF